MSLRTFLLPLMLLASLVACSQDASFEPDPTRAPLGKADSIGSCQGNCGQKANDCWCDDQCSYYGDCCDDKVSTCDAPVATACGGWLGDTCASDEYCHFEQSAICGFADASGTCQDKPQACTQIFSPVCGCDGQTYSNSCMANSAGTSVNTIGACQPQAQMCGGFGNLACPSGLDCVDDPNDDCDPNNGGADCSGVCVEPVACQPVTCTLACQNGFKTNAEGCEICECKPSTQPANSCADSCGGKSKTGTCYCDDACTGYGDCCADIDDMCSEPERVPASGMCIKNSNDQCQSDSDCTAGGCGGELCFNPAVSDGISTCECTTPTAVEGCGCVNGSCSWYNMQ